MNTTQETEPKFICLCDHCGQSIEAVSQWLGATAVCPHCGQNTVILSEQAKTDRARAERAQAAKLAEKQRRLTICPACEGKVSSKARTCPHCGQPFENAASWGSIFSAVFKIMVALLVWSVPFPVLFAVLRFIFNN
jgi:hypothetical protein